MPSTVFANFRAVDHKASNGFNLAFPDVCKTPTPAGPVPIPYPNIGQSTFTSQGSRTVKVDGQMAMVKGAKYSMTSGDEAGVTGGVVSNTIKGVAEYMLYSFDVKFDGKGVCRNGDMMFHNKKNIMS